MRLEYDEIKNNIPYLIPNKFSLNQTILFKKKIHTNNLALQAFSDHSPILNFPLYTRIISSLSFFISCFSYYLSNLKGESPTSLVVSTIVMKTIQGWCISEVEQDPASHHLTKKVCKTHRYYKNKQSPTSTTKECC